MKALSGTDLALDGLARMSEVTTAVLPMPISSASHPPRTPRPVMSLWPSIEASVERSTSIMKRRDCFWYGRSLIDGSRPRGSGSSMGYTCWMAARSSSQGQRSTRRGRWLSAGTPDDPAEDEPATSAAAGVDGGGTPLCRRHCCRSHTHEGTLCRATQCAPHRGQSEAGASFETRGDAATCQNWQRVRRQGAMRVRLRPLSPYRTRSRSSCHNSRAPCPQRTCARSRTRARAGSRRARGRPSG